MSRIRLSVVGVLALLDLPAGPTAIGTTAARDQESGTGSPLRVGIRRMDGLPRSGGHLRIWVTNTSSKPLWIHPNLALAQHPLLPLKVRVFDANGAELPYVGIRLRVGVVRDADLVLLHPNYHYGTDLSLKDAYSLPTAVVKVSIQYDTRTINGALAPAKRLWRGSTGVVSATLDLRDSDGG